MTLISADRQQRAWSISGEMWTTEVLQLIDSGAKPRSWMNSFPNLTNQLRQQNGDKLKAIHGPLVCVEEWRGRTSPNAGFLLSQE